MVLPPLITAFVSQAYCSDGHLHNICIFFSGHGVDIRLRRYRTEDLGGGTIVQFHNNAHFISVYILVNRPAFDQLF